MVNRNSKADLIKFVIVTGGIVFGIIALIAYSYVILDGKYLKALDARITNYIQEQWNIEK